MTEFNPKRGDMVLVQNHFGREWFKREFIVLHEGFYYCSSDIARESLHQWRAAKPLYDKPKSRRCGRKIGFKL